MKRSICAAAAAAALVAVLFLILRSPAKTPAKHANGSPGDDAAMLANDDAGHRRLDRARPHAATRLLDALLTRLDRDHPRKSITDESDRAPALIAAFERMLAMGEYFDGEALRRQEMSILLKDPENIDMAVMTITDLGFAQSTFQDKQALVRLFAIKLLEEQARLGDPLPLVNATRTLTARLNDELLSGRDIQKRQDRDLADLVTAAAATMDSSRLAEELPGFLETLGFKRDMHPAIVKVFDDSIFFQLLADFGREEARVIVAKGLSQPVD